MSGTLTTLPVASILVSEMYSGANSAVRAFAGDPHNRVGAVRATGATSASHSFRHHCKLLAPSFSITVYMNNL